MLRDPIHNGLIFSFSWFPGHGLCRGRPNTGPFSEWLMGAFADSHRAMVRMSQNIYGAFVMSGSMAFFALGDTCVKLIGTDMPLSQLLFLRGIVATACVAMLAWRMRGLTLRISRADGLLIALRSLTEVGAAYFFLTALIHMPLANVTALLQTLPLTVTLGAALVFHEPVGWRRASAIALGLLGMVLIVQPGGAGFSAWSIYGLIAVGCVTARDLVTRRISGQVPSLTVALTGVAAITIFGGVTSVGTSFVTMDAQLAGLLLAAAAFSVGAFSLSVLAMRNGDMSFTAPFRYVGLLCATILGFVVFGEVPNALAAIGCLIVVAAGVFTLLRERAVKHAPA